MAADENFNGHIVRALRRQIPGLDIVTIQEAGLRGIDDPAVLAWAAQEGRVLLTHDVQTLLQYAYERIRTDARMPGVFAVARSVGVGRAVEDLRLLIELSQEGEYSNRVEFVPF